MDMRSYIARKTVYLLITLFAIIAFNFFLFRIMPGDPSRILVPRTNDEELRRQVIAKFGLDKPLSEQFVHYLYQVFTLDFGFSVTYAKNVPINDLLGPPIFNTVLLLGIGTALAIWLGVMLGRAAAWRRGKFADTFGMAFALTFYSMPTFLFALIMVMVFGGTLRWFPLGGPYSMNYSQMDLISKIGDRLYHLVLPVTAFTIEVMAEYALIMRNSLTDVLTEDYIITARAKGLSNRAILHDHAMRNAMLPVVTVAAISFGWAIGGDIMVEIVFNYKGLGLLTWDAVSLRDFPVLQAIFLIMSITVLVGNFIADLIYMYLDPRVHV
jgi:peptide/nickel transport system permease protein